MWTIRKTLPDLDKLAQSLHGKPSYRTGLLNALIILTMNDSFMNVLDASCPYSNTAQLFESWSQEPLATQLARAFRKTNLQLVSFTHIHMLQLMIKLLIHFDFHLFISFLLPFKLFHASNAYHLQGSDPPRICAGLYWWHFTHVNFYITSTATYKTTSRFCCK